MNISVAIALQVAALLEVAHAEIVWQPKVRELKLWLSLKPRSRQGDVPKALHDKLVEELKNVRHLKEHVAFIQYCILQLFGVPCPPRASTKNSCFLPQQSLNVATSRKSNLQFASSSGRPGSMSLEHLSSQMPNAVAVVVFGLNSNKQVRR